MKSFNSRSFKELFNKRGWCGFWHNNWDGNPKQFHFEIDGKLVGDIFLYPVYDDTAEQGECQDVIITTVYDRPNESRHPSYVALGTDSKEIESQVNIADYTTLAELVEAVNKAIAQKLNVNILNT